MKAPIKSLLWFLLGGAVAPLGLGAVVLLTLDRAERPPAPPEGVTVLPPWGSIELEEAVLGESSAAATAPSASAGDDASASVTDLEQSLLESLQSEAGGAFDADGDGDRDYALLALSGGGSNGVFGAGLLCGWTEAGTRPDFKVVTGVSTGSLQAPFAFLGPAHDDALREIFTAYDTSEIYGERDLLAPLIDSAIFDTAPLKRLIDHYVTDELLAAVAEKHARGYRLYIGTTNLDAGEFVIWDMGRIASRGDAEAREHFANVLLASCAVPVAFPPVYLPVQTTEGETYYEMHADGGMYAQVFFRGFLLDFEDAMARANVMLADGDMRLFIIRNGVSDDEASRRTVEPRATAIASRTIESLFRVSTLSSLFRIYVLTARYGIDFNLASIPGDYPDPPDALHFGGEAAQRLFDFAYAKGRDGFEWAKIPPSIDRDEVLGR